MRVSAQRGFTLIEVLAAIVLLALAFAALLGSLGGAARLAASADTHTRAALCAQSALDSAFALTPVRIGVTEGRCDAMFRWQLQVSRWQPQHADAMKSPVRLLRLDLTVFWGKGDRRRQARFSTLRVQNVGNRAQAGGT